MTGGNSTRIEPVASLGDTPQGLTVTAEGGKRRRPPKEDPQSIAAEPDEETQHQLDELG